MPSQLKLDAFFSKRTPTTASPSCSPSSTLKKQKNNTTRGIKKNNSSSSASPNTKLLSQQVFTSIASSLESQKPKKTKPCNSQPKKSSAEQLYLDVGQKSFGSITCKMCGMVYNRGESTDEELHSKFCKNHLTLKFNGWKSETRLEEEEGRDDDDDDEESKNGRIIVITRNDDKKHVQKAQQVVEFIDSLLGFALAPYTQRVYKTYLCIIDGVIAGTLVAEQISYAHKVIVAGDKKPITATTSTQKSSTDAGVATSSDHQTTAADVVASTATTAAATSTKPTDASNEDSVIQYNKQKFERAVCGVSRIWVHPKYRKRGIAKRLVDVCRKNLVYGYTISPDEVAFSQPTNDGKAFAEKYTKTKEFLVYK